MKEEITVEELRELSPEQYIIYDIRDSSAFALGHIDGSVNVQPDDLGTAECPLPDGKTLIICCRSGIISEEIAERLRAEGRDAVNLVGGYVRWLGHKIALQSSSDRAAEIERA